MKKVLTLILLVLFILPILCVGHAAKVKDKDLQMHALTVLIAEKQEQVNCLYSKEKLLQQEHIADIKDKNYEQPDPIKENIKKDDLGRLYEKAVELFGEALVNQEDYYVKNEYIPFASEHQAKRSELHKELLQKEDELFALQKQYNSLLPIYS